MSDNSLILTSSGSVCTGRGFASEYLSYGQRWVCIDNALSDVVNVDLSSFLSFTGLVAGRDQKSHYPAFFSEPPTWSMPLEIVELFSSGLVGLHRPWCRLSTENPLLCLLCSAFTLADVAVQCLGACLIWIMLIGVCGREKLLCPYKFLWKCCSRRLAAINL